MIASLLPKSAPFFDMLLEQNALLRSMAENTLLLFTEDGDHMVTNAAISSLESKADTQYRRISRALSATFITPIDREDILRISQEQEECCDGFQRLSIRVTAYTLPGMLFPARRIAVSLCEMLDMTNAMLQGLPRRHDAHKTRAFRNKREEIDSLLIVGLAELMDESTEDKKSMVMTLKWIQIYEALEQVVRQISDVFETIEEAVMKNV